MSQTKASILAMESQMPQTPDGKYPRIQVGGGRMGGYIEPIALDEVTIDVEDGQTWEAFWIGGTNVSAKDTMFDYDLYIPGTNQLMVAGQEFTYHLGGDAVIFTDPIIGPAKFKMRKKPPKNPQMNVVLLPRQHGHHIFSEQVLQDLLADAVGKEHPLKNLIAEPHEYQMYKTATVIKAEITEKGIEAVVELGW